MSRKKFSRCTPFFILLAVAALSTPPAAAAETAAPTIVPCNVTAYVIDTDPKGLNVREGPGDQYRVVTTLPTKQDVEVTIIGSMGQWMQIGQAYIFADNGNTEDVTLNLSGWVWGPLLGLRTRATGVYPDLSCPLYRDPDSSSPVVLKLPDEVELPIEGCRGEWVKVNYKGTEGWLGPDSHCGNPVTTCV
jgi:SH3-like domain-containing protein